MLDIRDLSIWFSSYTFGLRKNEVCAVHNLDLSIKPGQIMAVIGQSGAGKSLLAHAILGILPRNARIEGQISFKGELLAPKQLQTLRGRQIALIPQSVTSLNPLLRVGLQVARAARLSGINKKDVASTVRGAFDRYHLRREITAWFPFQLSGGMSHRVLTATATVGMAELILADEPTCGLDPISARNALGHLRELANTGKAVLLITHDIEMALQVADMVAVFCEGTTVEVTDAKNFKSTDSLRHPYTRALWDALPANRFFDGHSTISTTSHNSGCRFQSYCDDPDALCQEKAPALTNNGSSWVRCHHA